MLHPHFTGTCLLFISLQSPSTRSFRMVKLSSTKETLFILNFSTRYSISSTTLELSLTRYFLPCRDAVEQKMQLKGQPLVVMTGMHLTTPLPM